VSTENQDEGISITNLRAATGVSFHKIGDKHQVIAKMITKYELHFTGDLPVQYCTSGLGLLLVNVIRCLCRGVILVNFF